MLTGALVLAMLAVAFANGANDNAKGVATLLASRTVPWRPAIAWATVTTLAGAAVSAGLSAALFKAFSGSGVVPAAVAVRPEFLCAVALAAAGAVLVATLLGLPVSTTHALTGALFGAGSAMAPAELGFRVLGTRFALPLLLSPLASMAITAILYRILRRCRVALGVTSESCLCIESPSAVPASGTDALACAAAPPVTPVLSTGTASSCAARYGGAVAGLSAQRTLDALHVLSSGAMSFARGLNDAPKLAALVVASSVLELRPAVALTALAMAAGGLVLSRKVAHTLSERIASMNSGQGFTASLVTAALVITATACGLPVSTTHVSCGAIFGIGAVNGTAQWRTIATIALSWLTTLPCAALFGAAAAFTLR